jgi:hypothetical protein
LFVIPKAFQEPENVELIPIFKVVRLKAMVNLIHRYSTFLTIVGFEVLSR